MFREYNQFSLIKELHTLFDSIATTPRNCRFPKGSSSGYIFFFTLKTQLIFVIFKYILFGCFRF